MAENKNKVTPIDKPTINLDVAEREKTHKPFVATIEGKNYTFLDAREVDWQLLLANYQDPAALLSIVVREEDQEEFFKLTIPWWKIDLLSKAYERHFGLADEGAPGVVRRPGNPRGSRT